MNLHEYIDIPLEGSLPLLLPRHPPLLPARLFKEWLEASGGARQDDGGRVSEERGRSGGSWPIGWLIVPGCSSWNRGGFQSSVARRRRQRTNGLYLIPTLMLRQATTIHFAPANLPALQAPLFRSFLLAITRYSTYAPLTRLSAYQPFFPETERRVFGCISGVKSAIPLYFRSRFVWIRSPAAASTPFKKRREVSNRRALSQRYTFDQAASSLPVLCSPRPVATQNFFHFGLIEWTTSRYLRIYTLVRRLPQGVIQFEE